jgi:hypothetical protein
MQLRKREDLSRAGMCFGMHHRGQLQHDEQTTSLSWTIALSTLAAGVMCCFRFVVANLRRANLAPNAVTKGGCASQDFAELLCSKRPRTPKRKSHETWGSKKLKSGKSLLRLVKHYGHGWT